MAKYHIEEMCVCIVAQYCINNKLQSEYYVHQPRGKLHPHLPLVSSAGPQGPSTRTQISNYPPLLDCFQPLFGQRLPCLPGNSLISVRSWAVLGKSMTALSACVHPRNATQQQTRLQA